MRLGDLDALKEEIGSWGMNDYEPSDFIDAIDAAPTVQLDENVIQEVLNKRCMTAVANEYLVALQGKKPQGEWEIEDAEGCKIWNCVCTECGHDPQEYIGGTENWWLRKQHLPNFCPNCGVRIVNVKGGTV